VGLDQLPQQPRLLDDRPGPVALEPKRQQQSVRLRELEHRGLYRVTRELAECGHTGVAIDQHVALHAPSGAGVPHHQHRLLLAVLTQRGHQPRRAPRVRDPQPRVLPVQLVKLQFHRVLDPLVGVRTLLWCGAAAHHAVSPAGAQYSAGFPCDSSRVPADCVSHGVFE